MTQHSVTHQTAPCFLAFDLGAESGRAVVGRLVDDRMQLDEVHRFSNGAVQVGDSLFWDALRLWSEIQIGLGKAVQRYGRQLVSLGLDTWGVDFGLLAADDTLIGNPYHYRDGRTNHMLEAAFARLPRGEIYAQTGIQFMQINSLFQLLAMAGSPALAAARTFLNIPDLFNFWLTGRKASEFTIATTTQCYNPRRGDWAWELLESLGLPGSIFAPIVTPGETLARLRPSVAEAVGAEAAGCGNLPVVAVGSHDTASAVAAVPAAGMDHIYLSSGTWSLMGVETPQPVITPDSLALNFTNEGGLNHTYRLLKNIMGLWLVQECRREWERQGQAYSYDELTHLAAQAPANGALINPVDSRFLPPGEMVERIQAFCRETGQKAPLTPGEIVRCALESLALEYRWVAEKLDMLGGQRYAVIHIIGGGSRNRLLNQLTADATGRTVMAGPVEATALGNLLAQALATGRLGSLAEGRALVARSFEVETFTPRETSRWEAPYARYAALREG